MENYAPKKDENFFFWKNLIIVTVFFTLAPIVLGTSLFSLYSLTKFSENENKIISMYYQPKEGQEGVKLFASLPANIPSISGFATVSDGRIELIRQYLSSYSSPLEPYASFIIFAADKYKLDFRLITAIAQQESNLCKIIPPNSYNCWGWGIHSGGTLGFNSFEEGIEIVSQGIREQYLNKGYETVEEIMSKYTPLSNGSWAYGVNKFMGDIE
jgi:hypothetical protein